jgi:hypothetical protein
MSKQLNKMVSDGDKSYGAKMAIWGIESGLQFSIGWEGDISLAS